MKDEKLSEIQKEAEALLNRLLKLPVEERKKEAFAIGITQAIVKTTKRLRGEMN